MKKIIIDVLLIVFTAVLVFSGYRLYSIFSEYRRGREQYRKTSEQFMKEREDTGEGSGAGGEEEIEKAPIEIDFDSLLKENPDVAGWIYCPDTVVNYPVMHGKDNELYLHHMVNKEYNFAGCIFEDCDNSPGQVDPATILYGHSMNDGSMFAMIHEYTKQEYYDKHPTMWYLTPRQNYRLNLVAGFVATDNDPVYSLFQTKQQMQAYLKDALEKSTFKSDKQYYLETVDRIIVLSTCAYEFNNARYILIAVPIPIG